MTARFFAEIILIIMIADFPTSPQLRFAFTSSSSTSRSPFTSSRLRVAFAATSPFAIPFFEEIMKVFDVRFLMTKAVDPKLYSFARFIQDIDMPCYYPTKMKEIDESIFDELDVMIVIAYGHKIPKRMLDRCTWINLHGSVLPKFRGAAPINYALMAGETETGLSSTIMVEQIDAGPVIDTIKMPINHDDNVASLISRMQTEGKEWFPQTIIRYLNKEIVAVPQDDLLATFAPCITNADRQIDWTKSATQIHNQIRGLSPAPCCSIQIDNLRIKIIESSVVQNLDEFANKSIGSLVDPVNQLVVRCGSGFLRLNRIIPESSKLMSDADFIRGHRGNYHLK